MISTFLQFNAFDDDVDVYFPLTRYYLQDTNHSNYLQLLSIIKEFKELKE